MFSSDFEKAFDSIDHCFMFACLKRFAFGTQFVQWVKTLFKNAQSCIMHNGVSIGYFALKRDTRHGDPLSTTSLYWQLKYCLFVSGTVSWLEVYQLQTKKSNLMRTLMMVDPS